MKDPTKPPGFNFLGLRLIKARYELLSDPTDGEGSAGQLALGYRDQLSVQEPRVFLRQGFTVKVCNPDNQSQVFLLIDVELEGAFEATSDPNMSPSEFGERIAPSILFP